ncbi:hypothetical protein O181_002643 [Austropuccinia psidii MF-1]|uniref:Uncharacterized protein n=1 Tax=Austropuccinia psidii MF-1 TaxID=1389203 RepID=A0A9Q3BD43_9BASI|nr:hypothetical protein [Austropuccinia psidii MF-1]
MNQSDREALKKLTEVSNWTKPSVTGEYGHMDLIEYIHSLLIDVTSSPAYWINTRFNTAFKKHSNMRYNEMKEIHGRKPWVWWENQIIQRYCNKGWVWQKAIYFDNDR